MQEAKELDQFTNVGFLFAITQVEPGAPEHYVSRHMQQYLAGHGQAQLQDDALRLPLPAIPLAPPGSLPTLRDSVLRQHAARTACVMQSVQRLTPLLEGETLVEESFSYLSKPYQGVRARAVVLLRTTNFGQLAYLFKHVVVDPQGRLLFIGPVAKAVPRDSDHELFISAETAEAIASKLAGSVLSSIGGAIGKSLFEKVFPPGVPSYFGKVYVEIKRVVGEELQQHLIDSVDGAIKSIQHHLEDEYLPAKAHRDLRLAKDREHLFALMQKYEATYLSGPGGMLGTLMNEKYAKLGFGVFLIAASLQLAMFQEMAVVDPAGLNPDGTLRSPLKSSYGEPLEGTVARAALKYAAFAEKTWPGLIADRRAKIGEGEGYLCSGSEEGFAACEHYAWFWDLHEPGELSLPTKRKTKVIEYRESGADKQGKDPGKELIADNAEQYRVAKVDELRQALGNPEKIIGIWRQLAKTPLALA